MSVGHRFALFVAVFIAVAPCVGKSDETLEPAIKYKLVVDGKDYEIVEGKPLKLQGNLNSPTVKLVAEPYREFTYGGIHFQYPRSFTFEAEVEDDDSKHWTLSGNDFTIQYFLTTVAITTEEYVASLLEQLGEDNCKISDVTIELFGAKQVGRRLMVTLAKQEHRMDVFSFTAKDRHMLLVLQDSPNDAGKPSVEARDAMEVLKKSMTLK